MVGCLKVWRFLYVTGAFHPVTVNNTYSDKCYYSDNSYSDTVLRIWINFFYWRQILIRNMRFILIYYLVWTPLFNVARWCVFLTWELWWYVLYSLINFIVFSGVSMHLVVHLPWYDPSHMWIAVSPHITNGLHLTSFLLGDNIYSLIMPGNSTVEWIVNQIVKNWGVFRNRFSMLLQL